MGFVALVSFVFVIFVALPAMSHGSHHGSIGECPFQQEMPSVCPLGLDDHLTVIHLLTHAAVPASFICLILAAAAVFFFSYRSVFIDSPPRHRNTGLYLKRLRERIPFILYFLLFSQGILHPRIW